jgi:alkanesulfonate monooxygenase SsuD/methylene tetrahydromethanopterin reductase-like flavin-dependent oxidoreductase (luciferase family)
MELGRYGIFGHAAILTPERARMIESLGYGTVWQGGSPPADLSLVAAMLDATATLKVATGIVNVWTADAAEVARPYHRIEAAHPDVSCSASASGIPKPTRRTARRTGR